MMILTRNPGESVVADGPAEFVVLGVKGKQVRVGINAHKSVSVDRHEVRREKDKSKAHKEDVVNKKHDRLEERLGLPETMDIYSKSGTKVTPVKKNGKLYGGSTYDKEMIEKHLDLDGVYTVLRTEVASWSTEVYLEEVEGIGFNTSCFIESNANNES